MLIDAWGNCLAGWMQVLWILSHLPSVHVRPLLKSCTEYLHFSLTGELQDFAFFPPVHDGMQLFLDALWRDLSSHPHCGGRVHWGATPAVVLSSGLGYVVSPAEFWTSVWVFIVFQSCSQRIVRGMGSLRSDGTDAGESSVSESTWQERFNELTLMEVSKGASVEKDGYDSKSSEKKAN